MSQDCVFCRIVAGELPARKVYEDDAVVAFHDIRPQSPVHVLVVPREHIGGVGELRDGEHRELAGRLLTTVPRVADAVGGLEDGYRLIVNNGPAGGQTVPHLHIHVLGGRRFGEGMVPHD